MGNGQVDKSLSRTGVATAALLLGLAISPAARAQMAVYDAANHVETSQTLAQALKLVDQGQQALSQLNAMKSAIGTVGGISSGVSSSLRSLNRAAGDESFVMESAARPAGA
jgi:hypothetical protein